MSQTIYVWPDGSWCWSTEHNEVRDAWKGDDFKRIEVTDDCDDEDAERIADLETEQDMTDLLVAMYPFGPPKLHSPAASYDFGTYCWGIDVPSTGIAAQCSQLRDEYVDLPTAEWAHAKISRDYADHCRAEWAAMYTTF